MKSGVEYLAQHAGWKTQRKQKTKHGVYVTHGVTRFRLSANDLELMADALEIINPDNLEQTAQAERLAMSFRALSEYVKSVQVRA